MKSVILILTQKLIKLIVLLALSSFSYSQNSLLLHLNPLYAADVNPASVGLGFEHSFKDLSIGISVLYTYMQFAESNYDQGIHTGYRIIADFRFPTWNPTLYYNIFPTYWRSQKKAEQVVQPNNFDNYKNRTKYGLGFGFVKIFRASNKISFDLSYGLELNYITRDREYYDFIAEKTISQVTNSMQPRVRSGFRMRYQL